MHQDAQTLTTETLPLNMAEGMREGSVLPSRNQNTAARAMNAISGSAISQERRGGAASVVAAGSLICSLIRCPPHCARSAAQCLTRRVRAGVVSGGDNRS